MPNNRDDSFDIANWTPHAEATLIVLLHEEVKKENTNLEVPKKTTVEFERQLFSLLGVRFTVNQLKGKFNRLPEQHQLFS